MLKRQPPLIQSSLRYVLVPILWGLNPESNVSGPSNQANPLDQKDLERPSKPTDFYLIPLYPRMDPDTTSLS